MTAVQSRSATMEREFHHEAERIDLGAIAVETKGGDQRGEDVMGLQTAGIADA